jgi:hypothetical protein
MSLTHGRRHPEASADPLSTLLRRAAAATSVAAVRKWLLRLLEREDEKSVPARRRAPEGKRPTSQSRGEGKAGARQAPGGKGATV